MTGVVAKLVLLAMAFVIDHPTGTMHAPAIAHPHP
jgi:hypothetical protein